MFQTSLFGSLKNNEVGGVITYDKNNRVGNE